MHEGRPLSSHVPGLTEQELEVARSAEFDLGAGYPHLPAPEFIRQSYRDDRLEDLSLMMAPGWTTEKQARLDQDLAEAVEHLLGCTFREAGAELRVTFSGSVAVDRAIMACLERARSCGAQRLEVVTTSPSIDIMRDFLSERADIDTHFVDCLNGDDFPRLDLDGVLDALQRPLPANCRRAALLTSPENPTGESWSRAQLEEIAAACRRGGHTLIVDHCFLLAGVQEDLVDAVWQVADPGDDWLAIWDTGKTFGLNGDKLGFLVASESLLPYVDDVLRVLQFDVSRRQKLFFSELLRFSSFYDYVPGLGSICRANLRTLVTALEATPCRVLEPKAGSLALVELPEGQIDTETCSYLLRQGVGVVGGSSFFHGDVKRSDLVRVALARDPAHFARAVDLLRLTLNDTSHRATVGLG